MEFREKVAGYVYNIGARLSGRLVLRGNELLIALKADKLSDLYICGDISLRQAHEIIDTIEQERALEPESLMSRFRSVNMKTAIRLAPPQV